MNDPGDFEAYLDRHGRVRGRKRLMPEEFERLKHEYARLKARLDPRDIQLDEWKRMDELRFLLVLPDEDDEEI
jgi:hypothetical protein